MTVSAPKPPSTIAATLPPWQRWTMLLLVSTALLLIVLDNSILYTVLPTLSTALHASTSEQLWIINAYPLMMASLLLGSGSLGDRFGHKRIFQVGLVIFGIASLVAAFSPSAAVLIAARALLGIGAAAMMPATLALIRLSFAQERERNLAIAVWASIATVGMAAGPIVAGILLEHFWWGSVFLINVPFILVVSILILFIGPKNRANPLRRWDWLSSLQALVGMGAAVLAIKTWADLPINFPLAISATLVAAVVLTIFVRRQLRLSRYTEPLVDFAIFRNKAFSAGVVAAGTSIFAVVGLQLVIAQRYQLVEGFTPLEAGMLVAVVAIASLPFSLVGGALLHRVGLLVLIGGGMSVAAAGAVLAVVAARIDSLPFLVVALLVFGVGFGAAMSVASTAIMGNVPPHRAGMAASLEEVSYEFGGLVGVATMGSLLSLVYSRMLVLPTGEDQWANEAPAETLLDAPAGVVAVAAEAFNSAYGAVMLAVAVVMILGAVGTATLLRKYRPGTPSQAFPDNH